MFVTECKQNVIEHEKYIFEEFDKAESKLKIGTNI